MSNKPSTYFFGCWMNQSKVDFLSKTEWLNEKFKNVKDMLLILKLVIAPAGFWPRGQNPRRHHCSPRVFSVYI